MFSFHNILPQNTLSPMLPAQPESLRIFLEQSILIQAMLDGISIVNVNPTPVLSASQRCATISVS